MGNRRISRILKGNAYKQWHWQKQQHEKMHVCKNNWIRRIMVVERADNSRLDELRTKVGVTECLKKKLVRSRLK